MPGGYLEAFLLAPASGSLRNESEHVQRGLVRVAGSPELAQLCCSREEVAVPGGGPRGSTGVGSQEPAPAPGRWGEACSVPGTHASIDERGGPSRGPVQPQLVWPQHR